MKAHISITVEMDTSQKYDDSLQLIKEISLAVNKFLYSWNREELLEKLKGMDYQGGSAKNLCITVALDKDAFIYKSTGRA